MSMAAVASRPGWSPPPFWKDGDQFVAPDPTLKRKFMSQDIALMRKAGSDERIGRGVVLTTEHIDRDGDIVRSSGEDGGIDWSFYRSSNPIVLLQHARGPYAFPVIGGNAILEPRVIGGKAGWVCTEFLFADTVLAREIAGMWRDMILRTASIGVMPQVMYPINERGERLDPESGREMAGQTGWEVAKSEGREWSIVAIPANPFASQRLFDAANVTKAKAYFDLGGVSRQPREYAGPPQRWNKDADPIFDVSAERLEPADLECEWASKFLGVPVAKLSHLCIKVQSARLGSFLYSLEQVLREEKYEEVATRHVTPGGQERPPQHKSIELKPDRKQTFLVQGTTFYGTPEHGLVISRTPTWWGLHVEVFARQDSDGAGGDVVGRAWDLAYGANNMLRGEAFSLSGAFIPKTDETWGSIFLTEENITPLRVAVRKLNEKGKEAVNRGILMAGPPGTGKTLSGRVMRNEAQATFIWVSSRDLYYSGSFGGITSAFDMARELAPAVLFFEDIDNWLERTDMDLLKTELDGVAKHTGVVTVLTTNYPERLPKALLDRPGRFHDVLKLDLPDADMRRKMLTAWMPGLSEEGLTRAVEETEGYSGAHLWELVAYSSALREDDEAMVVDESVVKALAKLRLQREVITGRQLAGSNYSPDKALAAAMSKAPYAKADDDDDEEDASKATCPECEAEMPDDANYCSSCGAPMNPEEEAADESGKGLALDEVGRLLKEVSVERCPGCRGAIPYARKAGRFVEHRHIDGELCYRKLDGLPTGPLLKQLLHLVRDTTRDTGKIEALPEDAGGLAAIVLAAKDLEAIPARCGVIEREIGRCIKDGRVLSAKTRQMLSGALDNWESAAKDMKRAVTAMRQAAGALRSFLAEADQRAEPAKAGAATGLARVLGDRRVADVLSRFRSAKEQ